MTTKPKPIPDGYHTVTPYLIIRDAAKALDFYNSKTTFTATGPGQWPTLLGIVAPWRPLSKMSTRKK